MYRLPFDPQAYATLDAGAVSTPAATLQPEHLLDPSPAFMPHATRPIRSFQEEAAALNYDRTEIFNFTTTRTPACGRAP